LDSGVSLESGRGSYSLVLLLLWPFQSIILIFGDCCYSGALVLSGNITMILLRHGLSRSDDEAVIMVACLRLAPVLVVIIE
jgi:hypothetical protein